MPWMSATIYFHERISAHDLGSEEQYFLCVVALRCINAICTCIHLQLYSELKSWRRHSHVGPCFVKSSCGLQWLSAAVLIVSYNPISSHFWSSSWSHSNFIAETTYQTRCSATLCCPLPVLRLHHRSAVIKWAVSPLVTSSTLGWTARHTDGSILL